MEFQTYTMTADLTNDSITIGKSMIMYCLTHISKESPWLYFSQSKLHTFLRYFYQLLLLRAYLTNTEHSGRIREISIQNGRAVNIYNISCCEDHIFRWKSMANLIIYRSTHTVRISFIIKWCGNTTHLCSHIIHDLIDLCSVHTLMDVLFQIIKYCNIDLTALLDLFNLLWCFDHIMLRHDMSHSCILIDFFIKCLMAYFIFFTAATPAGIVSTYFTKHDLFFLPFIFVNYYPPFSMKTQWFATESIILL